MAEAMDMSVLNTLREQLGDGLDNLLQVFLRQIPDQLAEIEAGLTAGDMAAAMRPAHTLKSSSATLGAMRLSEYVKEIEIRTRAGNGSGVQELVAKSREEFHEVEAFIRRFLAGS